MGRIAMSLINKLLQDLERRQISEVPEERLPGNLRSVVLPPRPPRYGLVIGATFLLTAALGGAWIYVSSRLTAAPELVQRQATPPAVVAALVPPPQVPKSTEPAAKEIEIARPEVLAAPKAAVPPVPAELKAKPVAEPAVEVKAAVPKSAAMPQAAESKAPVPKPAAMPQVVEAKAPVPKPAVVPQVVEAKAAPTPPAAVVRTPSSAGDPVATADVAAKPDDGLNLRMVKTVNSQQLSENLYKQAVSMVQQGKSKDARPLLRKVIEVTPTHVSARQMLASLMVEGGSIGEASALLREGVKLSPEQAGLRVNLARLQLESADTDAAMATLEQGLGTAGDDAQLHAFYAVLLQRSSRHDEAVKHYLVALRSDPSMPNWLVGLGISLQSVGRESDAGDAYLRARDSGRLPAPLASFVDTRLAQLKR